MDCSFAERLSNLMQERRLTLREVGEAIGVTGQAVHHWTKGGGITPDNVRKLATFLNISPSILFFGSDDGLTKQELEILSRIRAMDDATRTVVMDFINFQSSQMQKRKDAEKEYVYRFEGA